MQELKVINAVVKTADVDALFAEHVSDFFVVAGEVWEYVKNYYTKHSTMPRLERVLEKYPEVGNYDTFGPADDYIEDLREEYIKERTNRILTKGAQLLNKNDGSGPELLRTIQAQLARLDKYNAHSVDTNIMDFDAAGEHYESVRERIAAMGGTPGISTGIDFCDAAYPTGWAPGELVIVLGYTGRMKSFFTTLVACRAFENGYTPMIVSLEMNAAKIRDRVYTIMGSGMFQNSSLTMGDITDDQLNQFRSKYENGRQFIVVEGDGRTGISTNTLQPKINQYKPDLLILDYAQIMMDNAGNTDMNTKMLNLSNEAKAFAVANQIPVVLISSATPDGKVTDQPPTVEQVAWSKQIAYNADLAIAVHKQEMSNLVTIAARKNRNGPLFVGNLDWDVDNGKITTSFAL